MERSGFFNSKLVDGVYDRPYNADDYSSQLGTVIGNGVARTGDDDLKVSINEDGTKFKVNVGRAWINGCWYQNTSTAELDFHMRNNTGARIDRIVLRLAHVQHADTAERTIRLAYVEGTASMAGTPQAPALTRNDDVWELALADIYLVAGSEQTFTGNDSITDQRGNGLYKMVIDSYTEEDEPLYRKEVGDDLCGWAYSIVGADDYFTSIDNAMYEHMEDIDEEWQGMKDSFSSVTLFKKYEERTTLESTTTRINVTEYVQEFATGLDILEVFCNGIYLDPKKDENDIEYDYSLEGNVVVFAIEKPAGNEISFSVYKSIDSRGDVPSLLDMVEELQDKVATFQDMTEYTYFTTGIDDNLKLSQVVTNFLLGEDNGQQLRINVYNSVIKNAQGIVTGRTPFNIETPTGEGTSTTNRYRWFDFGSSYTGNKRVVLDFSNCDRMTIPIPAGSFNVIFVAKNVTLIGASFYVSQTATNSEVQGFASRDGEVKCYNCSFEFKTYTHSYVAENGIFEDCYADIQQESGIASCFDAHTNGLLIIRGGEYRAYSKSGTNSYVIKATQTGTTVIADCVNCPTVARTGYAQSHAVYATTGIVQSRETISTLTIANTSSGSTSGTISVSKPRRSVA